MGIPDSLKANLSKGKVLPFVGAGVSMAVKRTGDTESLFPSWKQLLLAGAGKLRNENKAPEAKIVEGFLEKSPPDYFSAAKESKIALGPLWYAFLKEHIDRQAEDADPASMELAKAVWKLGSNLIVTTNYDKVLRWASPTSADTTEWDIQAPVEQANAIRDGVKRPTVWHLHGHIGNSSKMILAPDGYQLLYPDATDSKVHCEAALKTLENVIIAKNLLFIGFSMDDEYFENRLNYINSLFAGATGPHYMIVKKGDADRIRVKHPKLETLECDDWGQPLLELLNELAQSASHSAPPQTASVHTPTSNAVKVADYGPHKRPYIVRYRPKGNQVIGIDAMLQKVRSQFTRGSQTAIGQTASFHGMGGLGKTQLAVEYADRFGNEYPNGVIWIHADQDIDAQLTEIAVEAKWVAPESEHKVKLDVAKHRLKSYSECLIIFDNIENLDAIGPYLPEPGANPHLLATSRHDIPNFDPVHLDVLTPEQACELLLLESGRTGVADDELTAAKAIVEKLAGLPLAIEIAGAYLKHRNRLTFREYCEQLSRNLKEALPEKYLAGSFTKHEQGVFSTLKINESSYRECPMLLDVLNLLAYSGTAYMGRELIAKLLGSEADSKLDYALNLGAELKILQKTTGAERYMLHRLVREVGREEFKIETHSEWIEGILDRLGEWFEGRRREFTNLPAFEAEIDHLHEWLKLANYHSRKHSTRLTWLLAYPPYHRGNYKEASALLEKATNLYQANAIVDEELSANLFNDNGYLFSRLGDYQKALEHSRKALKIRERLFGENHRDTATSYRMVGTAYSNLGNYKEALKYAQKAVKILEGLFGENHPDTAASNNNVGLAYSNLGNYKEAFKHVEKAMKIHEGLFGENHRDTATSYNNVGLAYSDLGNYKEAFKYAEKALKIHEELFGENHPDTATSYSNVGMAYSDLGNYNEALKYAEKAMKIDERLFGENHPDTATSYGNVGTAHSDLGNYKEALKYAEKAMKIDEGLFGENHPGTATSCGIVGTAHSDLCNYTEALKYAEKAMKILEEVLGITHPETVISVMNVAKRKVEKMQNLPARNMLDDLLKKLPKDHIRYDEVKRFRDSISVPGFRK